MGEKQTEALRAIANETGSTMHMVLMSAFHVLLSKYSGQEDIVIGTPVAGRPHAELQNMMGMFVNTIALRNYAGGGKTYLSFLEEVKQNALLAYDNQSYQFEELIDKLQLNRDISRHPLFDVMFTMNHRDGLGVGISEGSLLKPMIQPSKQSKFDLTLHIIDGYQELKGSFEYATSLFKKETIERMVQHFKGILDNICEYKEIKISDIAMITEVEKQQITYAFNHKKVNFPRDKTIVQMFEEQVIKTPDRVAVKFKSQTFTYKELNQKSNQLAYILREKGISSESIVGIMVEKSMELVVGILAILKAGGAYLPIDPKIPDNRKEYIINDSELELLITSNGFISTNKELLTIDLEDIALNGPSDNLPLINKPKDLAYIIYTSGTTGNPKGVMVEHSNVVQLMANDKMPFSFSERDVWTMFHSPAFDFSVWEMYGALLYGGKLVIVPDLVAKETNKYLSLLKEEKVTVLNQTPTAFYNLLQQELQYRSKDLSLRYIIFGGEALKPSMLDGWQKKYVETKLINMYGITETTVHVTFKEIGIREIRDGASNIGNTLPTLKTLIVDKNLNVQPVGVPGELCVGGAGVTRGYLNREVLTKERFIKHPDFGNERFYRSGDLVKLLSNGEIEYLGRIDHQVKIRGFRIELGEIENGLISNENVKEAVVLAKEDSQHQIYLCAYIVCHKALNKADIKSFLKERLPEYMIPTYFMEIDKIPLTNNGKVNRIALPEPDESGLISSDYEAPETANQKELVGIWKNILGVESIGIQDNFFDLGGHSLKATILISEIHKDLGIELPLKEVFMNPTIKELSKSLESAKKDTFETIKVYEDREYYETSSAQKRMYTFQNLDSTSTAYNMPGIFEIEGDVNRNQLENTFRQLIQRHEGLRTYFETIDGEIVQKIKLSYQFYLNRKVDQENDMTDIVKNFVRPFELDKGPLFRAELLENKKKKYLLIDMHHIISDGVSMSVLINELNKLYSGEFLEPLRIQYKDFAHWQNNLLKSGGLDKQEAFWKKQFEGNIPVLHLPYDYERPSKKSFIGETLHFDLSRESSLQIRILAKEQGVSLHMLLLSAFNILLSKYSGQEDIITGVPVAGRPHVDLQNIMGMFVNTLALRTYPNKDKSVRKFIEEVKESSLQAYDNQSYQLEELISAINIVRDKGRNPLFDVLFDMDNQDVNSDIKLNEVTLKPKKFESDVAKFDLTLVGIDRQENIEMYFEYSSMLFKRKTIERAISDLKTILKSMVEDIDKPLKSISIHTEEEIEILLKEEENLDSISDQDFAFDF
ncbi:amino acid adenylation domain-containing protein [Niallia taxi]|uniref:amino acid adenylation domain-containing protein n=1 Tax=Niallia taxi TaxID=2499688 RepID=UPI0021A58DB4|nr:amino acid adenylation domain-containing protein [Niallia taxi]MCT2347486.1 amino acid adenylation domain-containing protein [Niallia taxi]